MRLRQAVLAAALCALATPSFAQGISGGVKVGVAFNTVSIDPNDSGDISNRTGFVVGGFIEAPITPKVSIQPEVLWKQGGAKFGGDEFGDETATLEFNTIDIPILLKANLGSSSSRPFVVVGPVFGFKAGDAKFTVGDFEDPEVNDSTSSTDFAIAFGAGLNVKMLSVEVRYNLGLKDLSNVDLSETVKSRSFMILAGLGF